MSQHTSVTRASARAARAARFGGGADILLAASLWGTTGTVRTFAGGASALSIAASRVVIGGAVLLALAAWTRLGAGLRRLLGNRRNPPPLALGAAAIAVYQTAFFVAAGRTGVAAGTVVTIGSAPAFTGVIGLMARRSRPTGRWAAATAGAVAGCALLIGGGRDAGIEPVGIALALLSGLAYAVYATIASVLITRGEEDRAVAGAAAGARPGCCSGRRPSRCSRSCPPAVCRRSRSQRVRVTAQVTPAGTSATQRPRASRSRPKAGSSLRGPDRAASRQASRSDAAIAPQFPTMEGRQGPREEGTAIRTRR